MANQYVTGIAWGLKKRLEFIEFKLFWEGKINRGDLKDFFNISIPQASADLGKYIEIAPYNLDYNRSGKYYYPKQDFKPLFSEFSANEYLTQLLAISQRTIDPKSAGINFVPPIGEVPTPSRVVEPSVLKSVLAAINEKQKLYICYQSMSSPEPKARWISPHSLAFDEFRWHVRAFCHIDNTYKDFVLGRIISILENEPSTIDSITDSEWHKFIPIHIAPNPKLNGSKIKVIELDYGMTDGKLELKPRIALARYLLKRLGLHKVTDDICPTEQQIILLNKEEVLNALNNKLTFNQLQPSTN